MSNLKTMTEKVFERYLVPGSKWQPGELIRLKPNRVLLQDATGVTSLAYYLILRPDARSVEVPLAVLYIDHNTLAINNRNPDDQGFLQSVCARLGIYCSLMGNGICHQVNTERFAKPYDLWVGSDSHTPTSGAHGCIAIGCGGLEAATVLAGYPFEMKTPNVYGIHVTGKLKEWVEAKDVILEVLRRIGVKGGLGYVLEFFGPGVKTLSLEERATISNMGAETGATTTIFPADEQTRKFLRLQGREHDFEPLFPDRGVKYDKVMRIDLAEVVPLVAVPHSPGNVRPVREVAGLKVAQVAIGSSVNSWFTDMAKVDAIWNARTVHPDVTAPVTPGSAQILNTLVRARIWERLVKAGATPITPMCSWCVGMGNAPPSNSISVRTGNRNFKGRSGTVDDRVYLVSPSTAAATAVEGCLIDPRDFAKKYGLQYPKIRMPKPPINDSRIIPPLPKEERAKVEIIWGPNHHPPEKNPPMPDDIRGRIELVLGDDISTGYISPDGADTMSKRSDIPAISMDTFKNIDPYFVKVALENKERGVLTAIVAGENYGEGSSREHAALCPRYLGVTVVFAKSFGRIHRRNLIQHGILPVYISGECYLYMKSAARDKIEIFELADVRESIKAGRNELALAILKSQREFKVRHDLGSERSDEPEMVLQGGLLNLLLAKNS